MGWPVLRRLTGARALTVCLTAGASCVGVGGPGEAAASNRASGGSGSEAALFGYNDAFEDGYEPQRVDAMLEAAVAGNAEVIRFPISWCRVAENTEPGREEVPLTRDDWDWSGTRRAHHAPANYERLFELVRARNVNRDPGDDVRVVAELLDSPSWANSRVRNQPEAGGCSDRPLRDPRTGEVIRDGAGSPIPESAVAVPPSNQHLGDWREFVGEVLRKWGASAYGIAAVEVWNEPNLPPFWGSIATGAHFAGQPRRYGRLFNATAAEVGRRTPVLFGGLVAAADNAPSFLRRAVGAIRRSDLDGVGVHLYAQASSMARTKRQLVGQWKMSRSVAAAASDRNRPVLWITETGFPLRSRADEPVTVAQLVFQCRRLTWAYGRFTGEARSFVVHSLVDLPHEPRLFGVGSIGPDSAFTPRPSYLALAEGRPGKRPRCE